MRPKTRFAPLFTLLIIVVVGSLAAAPTASAWPVTQTVQPKLKRTYHWTIEKSVSQQNVTLLRGQSATVTYSVTVSPTGWTDSDWSVSGNVHMGRDPAIEVAWLKVTIQPDGAPATVGCSPSPFPVALGAAGLDCSWSSPLSDASPRTASMRAMSTDGNFRTLQTPFDFSSATVDEIDECVEVTDSMGGALGTVCAADGPKTFTYTATIGPYSSCGTHTTTNTAVYRAVDSGATGDAVALVNAFVSCGEGCTRTIGYWKTHAGFGPQADMVTPLLPVTLGTPGGAKSLVVTTASFAVQLLSFEGSNGVFAASNGINKLYAQLLGAKLNAANGVGTATVASTIAAADAFLAGNDSLSWSGLSKTDRSTVLGWMTTLDAFNNGRDGPQHCD